MPIEHVKKNCTVDGFYPGEQGGAGLVDVVIGRVAAAGRLPVTYYRSDSDLPKPGSVGMYPDGRGTPKGVTYRHFTGAVDFPFGHGLSYTSFEYKAVRPERTTIGPCETLAVEVDVTNSGSLDSDEVVQLYVKQRNAAGPVPRVRLADFARVHIPSGLTRTVSLVVAPRHHYRVVDQYRALIFCLQMSQSMPTANADGLRRSEGTVKTHHIQTLLVPTSDPC